MLESYLLIAGALSLAIVYKALKHDVSIRKTTIACIAAVMWPFSMPVTLLMFLEEHTLEIKDDGCDC